LSVKRQESSIPRFYFHLISPGSYSTDDIGGEFADVETAYLDARLAALEIAFEILREHRDPAGMQFEIVDAQGRFLIEVPFSEVLRPAGRPKANAGVLDSIRRSVSRNRELQAEINAEFVRTRRELENARAMIKRSRANALFTPSRGII